jgi:hypothetical protein
MLLRALFALALLVGTASVGLSFGDDPFPGCDPCPGAQVR